MTKAIAEIRRNFHAQRPARELCSFTQQIQAADEAWQDFIRAQACSKDNGCAPHEMVALSAFARFLHELLPDRTICGPIIRDFEQRIMGAEMFEPPGTFQ